jgi:hypothetical protein
MEMAICLMRVPFRWLISDAAAFIKSETCLLNELFDLRDSVELSDTFYRWHRYLGIPRS